MNTKIQGCNGGSGSARTHGGRPWGRMALAAAILAAGVLMPGCSRDSRRYSARDELKPRPKPTVTARKPATIPSAVAYPSVATHDDVFAPRLTPVTPRTEPKASIAEPTASAPPATPAVSERAVTPERPAISARPLSPEPKPAPQQSPAIEAVGAGNAPSPAKPTVSTAEIEPGQADITGPKAPAKVASNVDAEVPPSPENVKPAVPAASASAAPAAIASAEPVSASLVDRKPDVRTVTTADPAPTLSTTKPAAPETSAEPAPNADVAAKPVTPEQAKLRARLAHLKDQLKNGALVDDRDDRGRTLLQQAAIANELETVEVLIDAGANVKAQDRQGWTALHWAASSGNLEICEVLIASGATVDARGHLDDAPLYWAAAFDRREVAELLLARGADVSLTDKRGRSALFAAVENDARETAVVLLTQSADVNAADETGLTPLHQAVLRTRKALLELEEQGSGDPSSQTRQTARRDILSRSKAMIALLIDKGAKVNATTPRGVTPLHLAAWDDTRELAELLLKHGADSNAKDQRDRTPLDYARQRNQQTVTTSLAVSR